MKNHVALHVYLVPAKGRFAVEPQGNRGRRLAADSEEAFHTGWNPSTPWVAREETDV